MTNRNFVVDFFAKFDYHEKRLKSIQTLLIELDKYRPNGLKATDQQKKNVLSRVKLIEQMNPTSKPAYSSKMDGFWRLIYTDFEPAAASSGKLGPFIGDVFQLLDSKSLKITNILRISFPPITGKCSAFKESPKNFT